MLFKHFLVIHWLVETLLGFVFDLYSTWMTNCHPKKGFHKKSHIIPICKISRRKTCQVDQLEGFKPIPDA